MQCEKPVAEAAMVADSRLADVTKKCFRCRRAVTRCVCICSRCGKLLYGYTANSECTCKDATDEQRRD